MSAERGPDGRLRSLLVEAVAALTSLAEAEGRWPDGQDAMIESLIEVIHSLKEPAARHGFQDLAKLADLVEEALPCALDESDALDNRARELLGGLLTGLRGVAEGILATGQEDAAAIARLSLHVSAVHSRVPPELPVLSPTSHEFDVELAAHFRS